MQCFDEAQLANLTGAVENVTVISPTVPFRKKFMAFFSPIIALIYVFCLTDGAARIFCDSPLSFSPGTSHLMVEESPSVRERERVHMVEE